MENLVEQKWLCRYPLPTIIMYYRINEFMGHTFRNNQIKINMVLNTSVKLHKTHKRIKYYK